MKHETIKKYLAHAALPLYMAAMLCLDLLFRAMYGYVGGWKDTTLSAFQSPAIFFSLLWVLLFGAVVYLLPRVLGRIFMVLTGLVNCILVIVHAVMYHLFGSFFGFHDLLYAGEGAAFFSSSYLHMRKLLLIGVLFAFAAIVVAVVFLPRRANQRKRMAFSACALVLSVTGIALLNNSMLVEIKHQETMSWAIANKKDLNANLDPAQRAYSEFTNPNACLPLAGLYQYTARDLLQSFLSREARDRSQNISSLNDYFNSRPAHTDNAMTGALAGKNVIMIMVESLDSWMLTEGYMPNLSALAKNSLQFNHFYTPLYLSAGTFSTEFTVQTGIIPPTTGATTEAYVENAFPAALPNLFSHAGYRANSFHNAYPSIYNRGKIHANLGFSAYYCLTNFYMKDYMLDTELLNGFDYMVDQQQPFYSFIITYSGHGPYNESFDSIALPHLEAARQAVAAAGVTGPADTMEQFTRAVAQIMETDDFIGGLVDRLEAAGLLEDTVLIIYGDHYAKYLTDADFLQNLKGVSNRNLLCNTPLLIYNPSLSAQTIEKYGASVDLFPTVCNLFSLDVDLRYFVGEDLFSDAPELVYWRDGSYYTGEIYCESAQECSDSPEKMQRYEQVQARLNASWESFQNNYFFYTNPIVGDK